MEESLAPDGSPPPLPAESAMSVAVAHADTTTDQAARLVDQNPVDSTTPLAHAVDAAAELSAAAIPTVVSDAEPSEPALFDPTPVIRGYVVDEVASAQPAVTETRDPPSETSHAVVSPEHDHAVDAKLLEAPSPVVPSPSDGKGERKTPDPQHEAKPVAEGEPGPHESNNRESVTTLVEATVLPTAATPALETTVTTTTDRFKPDTRAAWSQLFGSRFEDEPVAAASGNERASDVPQQAERHAKPSLRLKLDHGRRLDRQIQANRIEYRERVMRERTDAASRTAPTMAMSPKQTMTSSTPTKRRTRRTHAWLATEARPFEDAGLTPTVVRFCVEKALRATTQCFQQLHAIAQDEPEPPHGIAIELGLFVTQWELDAMLLDLFGQGSARAAAPGGDPASVHLDLHHDEYTFPLPTLLQVSWFLPFEQFARQRTLVAQISRKHLSERKLALLNTTLHRQLVALPHGASLQTLLLRLVAESVAQSKPKPTDTQQPAVASQASDALVQQLLQAIHVPLAVTPISVSLAEFLRLSPVDLASTLGLTSVVTTQRLVFFRFLIEALAVERARVSPEFAWLRPSSVSKTAQPAARARVKASERASPTSSSEEHEIPKKRKPKRRVATTKRRSSKSADRSVADPDGGKLDTRSEGTPSAVSGMATVGSCTTLVDAPSATTNEQPAHSSAFAQLRADLDAALLRLVREMPWLVTSSSTDNASAPPQTPATSAARATFLAAEAFQHSLLLLESTGVAPTAMITTKICEFTASILDILARPEPKAPSPPPPRYSISTPAAPDPSLSTARDRTPSLFPPPYVDTKPSYWTFSPDLPAPLSSIPRSVAKDSVTTTKPAPSPGVGDYDLRRGDKLLFQRAPGFSFARPSSASSSDIGSSPPSAAPPSISKKRAPPPPPYGTGLDVSTNLVEAPAESVSVAHASTQIRQDPTDDDVHAASASDTEDLDLESPLRHALRQQHLFVLDDMVQNLISRHPQQKTPSAWQRLTQSKQSKQHESTRSNKGFVHRIRRVNASETSQYPSSSSTTSARRTASTARSPRATTATPAPATARGRVHTKPQPQQQQQQPHRQRAPPPPPSYDPPAAVAVKMPPRDYEPVAGDEHLHWATRVSEFYKAKRQQALEPAAS